MYKMFRKTVERIIKEKGVDYGFNSVEDFFAKEEAYIKIQKPNFLPFSIDKSGDLLHVGFYRLSNGDFVSDPIFCFQIKDNIWYPIRLEQVLGDTVIGFLGDEGYKYYPSRSKDVRSFATTCAKEWEFYFL